MKKLVVDHNYIEVLPSGTCFSIAEKKFVTDPPLKGSPRAFVHYLFEEDVVPFPQDFVYGKETVNHCYFLANTVLTPMVSEV